MKIIDFYLNKKYVVTFFLLIFTVLFLVLAVIDNYNIHGKAVDLETPSNVSIMKSLALSFSSDLSGGIHFGEVNFLPSSNVDAVVNYNGTSNSTLYYVDVSSDGNTAVDLCLRAAGDLINEGGDNLGYGNETYSSSVGISNLTLPSLALERSMNITYDSVESDVPLGERIYLRFWLDVPTGQASGNYNNSIYFNGVSAGSLC